MSIYALNPDSIFRCLIPLNGIELAKARMISKKIKFLIDKNESIFFYMCMKYEFPKELPTFEIDGYNRQDWKNIYIAIDQFKVMEKRDKKHKKVIKYRKNFEGLEPIFVVIELVLGCVTGIFNFAKIASLGFSVSRSAIMAFLKANPGATVKDAIKALDIILPFSPPQITGTT